MTLFLSDIVVCGQITNRQRNSVRGWIRLRGFEHRIWISLTGNCAADLFGKSFCFESTHQTPGANGANQSVDSIAPRQIGPVRTMTSMGRVQVANCSAEELLNSKAAGAALTPQWTSSLYLEWFGQDGRIIIELLNAKITFVDDVLDGPDMEPVDDALWDEAELLDDEDTEDDDPYGLFPDDLEQRLQEESAAQPSPPPDAGWSSADVPPVHGAEVPLRMIFDPPIRLFPTDQLTDRQIEEFLLIILARLARHGVALDMCEHCTPRNAYRLLFEQILPNESIPAELAASGFVQQYTTHEFCPICLLQFMEEEGTDGIGADLPWDAPADDE